MSVRLQWATFNACTRRPPQKRHVSSYTKRDRAGRAYCSMCVAQRLRERAATGHWIGGAVAGVS